jgi:hypothetical protein
MLTTLLLIILLLFFLIPFYFAWVVRHAVSDTEDVITVVTVNGNSIDITAELIRGNRPYKIIAIRFPREYGEKLGVSTPIGFKEQPLTVDDTANSNNSESAESIQELNQHSIFWTGRLPLLPKSPVNIQIPFEKRVPGHARLSFRYEGRVGFSTIGATFHTDVSMERGTYHAP